MLGSTLAPFCYFCYITNVAFAERVKCPSFHTPVLWTILSVHAVRCLFHTSQCEHAKRLRFGKHLSGSFYYYKRKIFHFIYFAVSGVKPPMFFSPVFLYFPSAPSAPPKPTVFLPPLPPSPSAVFTSTSQTVLVLTVTLLFLLCSSYYPPLPSTPLPPLVAVVLHRGQLLGVRGKWESSLPPAVVIYPLKLSAPREAVSLCSAEWRRIWLSSSSL